jgi:putative ABC transport system permease protein
MGGGMFGLLAFIALVLAAVGLYAVTAYGVAQRTQEIGIRMALGARAPQVVWLFMHRTIAQLVVGVTVGLGGSLATGSSCKRSSCRPAPVIPSRWPPVSALLIVVAVSASFFLARRAARVDPIVALRYE